MVEEKPGLPFPPAIKKGKGNSGLHELFRKSPSIFDPRQANGRGPRLLLRPLLIKHRCSPPRHRESRFDNWYQLDAPEGGHSIL